jgi:hypothetical protein
MWIRKDISAIFPVQFEQLFRGRRSASLRARNTDLKDLMRSPGATALSSLRRRPNIAASSRV